MIFSENRFPLFRIMPPVLPGSAFARKGVFQAVQQREPERQAGGLSAPLARPMHENVVRAVKRQDRRISAQAKQSVFPRYVVGDEPVLDPFE
jgi:hypothetical protein